MRKKIVAYHEAGHAVSGIILPKGEEVHKITIIPRGMAGGYTMYKTDEDKSYISKTEMEEKLIALLGGRAAEKIALDDISTGASNDIEVATKIARDMLVVYGMSDSLGPISLKVDEPYELQVFGDEIVDEVWNQIKILIDEAYIKAQQILLEHREILDKVAQKLLEKEKVAVVPGNAFGECGEGYVRISYAYSLENIKIALDKIKHFMETIKKG